MSCSVLTAQALRQESFWANRSEVNEAEARYYAIKSGAKASAAPSNGRAPAASSDSDDIDFFADSDDAGAPKPKLVKPEPRAAPASKKQQQQKKDGGKKQQQQGGKKQQKQQQPRDTDDASDEGGSGSQPKSGLAAEIAKARQHIKNSLECVDGLAALAGAPNAELTNKVKKLEAENKDLKKITNDLKNLVLKLEGRVNTLESGKGSSAPAKEEEDDDDVDLFGSDSDEDEDAEKVRVREERLKAYHEKKSKKPALIAKTSVLLDCKPWDDETDMDAMLKQIKTIEKEGLVWGANKLVPVGYGINKLQVMCVVEDDKVSIDELCEQITDFEDYVQSVDIAAMSKI